MKTETATKTAAELNAEQAAFEAVFANAYNNSDAADFDEAEAFRVQSEAIEGVRRIAADYIGSLVERPNDFTFAEIHPSEIKVGDVISGAGYFAGRVLEVKTFDRGDRPVYVFKCSYEGGGLYEFRYMGETLLNGCARGFRAHVQGNDFAKWHKAVNA